MMIETILLALGVLYVFVAVFLTGGFVMDQMDFVNPRYGFAIFVGVFWLPLFIYGWVYVPYVREHIPYVEGR